MYNHFFHFAKEQKEEEEMHLMRDNNEKGKK